LLWQLKSCRLGYKYNGDSDKTAAQLMDSDNTAVAAATGGLIRESWKAVELLQLLYTDSVHDCTEFAATRWIEHL
jgi:hypothetical protein